MLRGRATELAVVAVEDGFVGDAAAHVVGVAGLAEEDVIARGGGGVLEGAVEEVDGFVALAHEHVAELVGDDEGAHGANGVGKKRLRAVEGVDVAGGHEAGGALDGRPRLALVGGSVAGCLNGAGDLEGELAVVNLVLAAGGGAFEDEAAEIAVGGDVVEAVIVHADVGDVRGHMAQGLFAAKGEEALVAGGVVLEERHAELEALGPLGPAARGVFALHGEDGGAFGGVPSFVEGGDFLGREVEDAVNGGEELGRGNGGVDFHKR